MKHILLLLLIVSSCRSNCECDCESAEKTIKGTGGIKEQEYANFTKTRKVQFILKKNWQEGTYIVQWGLWIDGEVADAGDVFDVLPSQIDSVKAVINKQQNENIPKLLANWGMK